MELDPHGVALTSYFPRHLLRGKPQRHISMLRGHDYMVDTTCALAAPLQSSSLHPQDTLLTAQKNMLGKLSEHSVQPPVSIEDVAGQQPVFMQNPLQKAFQMNLGCAKKEQEELVAA